MIRRTRMAKDTESTIGLIPAAGSATRIAPLPVSKEVLPIGCDRGRIEVAAGQTLRRMERADITSAYVILRSGKWDIPTFLGDGATVGVRLAYVVATLPYGMPYSLDAAYSFISNRRVALGLPDLLFDADDTYVRLSDMHDAEQADVTLGLFPADRPETMDVVETRGAWICRLHVKPARTSLTDTWGVALWSPRFTEFLHAFLAEHRERAPRSPELHLGHVFQAALDAGLAIAGTRISATPYVDIGLPENLTRLYGASPLIRSEP